jgi:Type II intron maturase
VLSAICPKEEAEEIYRKIETFLDDELKLNTSKAKSGLKHNTEVIRFLGYDIIVKNTDRTVRVTTKDGQHYKKRSLVGQIKLHVPEEKLKNFSDKKGYGNWITRKAMQRGFLINVSDAEITLSYSAELRGFAQYYALASNYSHAIGKLRILWIQSYLKTMANKHKMSVQKVATMLNRGSYMAVREKGKTGKGREIKLFKPKDVKREAIFDDKVDTPPLTFKYVSGSELLRRKDANKCEYCEREGGYFEIHHVKKLANMKKGTQTWQRLMIARQRKTLVLCVECHDKLHAGTLPDVRHALIDIIGDSVYLFHANLFDLTRQTARVLGCDQPDARRVRPCAASLCCGLCCPLSARQDLGRQGTPTPERRWRQRRLAADGRQTVLYPRLPENPSLANHAWLTI